MKRILVLAIASAVAALACGDDEETQPTTTVTSSTASTGGGGGGGAGGEGGATGGGGMGTGGIPSGPGTITVTANLPNGDGQLVVASVLTPDRQTTLGRMCDTVEGGMASGVVSEIAGMNTCMLGAEIVFDAGDYRMRAALYDMGQPMPSGCLALDVTVAGDTVVPLPAFQGCQ
jgi:hypothetical protein